MWKTNMREITVIVLAVRVQGVDMELRPHNT